MPPFEAIKDRPQGDHVIATTRKSSESTKIIYSSWIEIVSHWGECSYLRVVSCGPWQLTPKSITCLLLLLPSSPALMALQTTMPQFLINISGRCRVRPGGNSKILRTTSSPGGFSSPESSPFSSQEFEYGSRNFFRDDFLKEKEKPLSQFFQTAVPTDLHNQPSILIHPFTYHVR